MKRRRLILVGKGDGWKNAPSYGDFETWGVNDLITSRPVDMVFDMHPLDQRWNANIEDEIKAMDLARATHDANHQAWLNTQIGLCRTINTCTEKNIPLMTLKEYDFSPTSIGYPLKEVSEALRSDNFTNGIDYMIAFAIYTGVFTDLELYGINMAMGSEYEWEKPGCDFWLGMAKGRGIRVNVNSHVTLLMKPRDGKLYGFGTRQTFKEESCMSTQIMEFSVLERVVLLNAIPKTKGSYEQVKSIDEFKKALAFPQEEQDKLKFVTTGPEVHWDDKAEVKKEIEVNDYVLSTIVETLKWMSNRSELPEGQIPIYERFVVQHDGRIEGQVTISEQIIHDHERAKNRKFV